MRLPVKQSIASTSPEQLPKTALPGFENIQRFWDIHKLCYCAKLLPGEYYVTTNDELIVTTLGSCVAACIRDPVNAIGGMNHFMLPNETPGASNWQHPNPSRENRYGAHAMENLINDILKNGGVRKNLEIKVFGGGKILAHMTDIGQRNITFIEHYIKTEGLNLLAEDVGSIYPRKVIYNPLSGKARVKKLRSVQDESIIQREHRYLKDIQTRPLAGEIEIF